MGVVGVGGDGHQQPGKVHPGEARGLTHPRSHRFLGEPRVLAAQQL